MSLVWKKVACGC